MSNELEAGLGFAGEPLVGRLRLLAKDHAPDGWPAVQMRDITRILDMLSFYRHRCDAMQREQSRMRDPERTLVCDILANGALLPDPDGKRYGPPNDKAQPGPRCAMTGLHVHSEHDAHLGLGLVPLLGCGEQMFDVHSNNLFEWRAPNGDMVIIDAKGNWRDSTVSGGKALNRVPALVDQLDRLRCQAKDQAPANDKAGPPPASAALETGKHVQSRGVMDDKTLAPVNSDTARIEWFSMNPRKVKHNKRGVSATAIDQWQPGLRAAIDAAMEFERRVLREEGGNPQW